MKAFDPFDPLLARRFGKAARTVRAAIALFFVLILLSPPVGSSISSQWMAMPNCANFWGVVVTLQANGGGAGEFESWAVVADGMTEEDAVPSQDTAWPLRQIGADLAIANNITGKGIRVAVIDTGIDYDHPALRHAYRGGYDFVNNDTDPYDDNGHGTFVAGVIAGIINGMKGSLGAAPDVEVYAIKVMGADGKGQVNNILNGIQWAIDNDVKIICMSLSLFRDFPELRGKLGEAYSRGILIVAAAGNTGGRVTFPASYETVIAVGSVDIEGQLSKSSSRGPEVEVVAPGVNILSTVPGGGYSIKNGTSYAAGYVAGALALLVSSHPDLDAEGMRALLQEGASDLGLPGRDYMYGYGLVNMTEIFS